MIFIVLNVYVMFMLSCSFCRKS